MTNLYSSNIILLSYKGKRMKRNICKLFAIFTYIYICLFISSLANATEHNLLPRFPEIVIEKEYSQYFKVKDCQAKAIIEGDHASTDLKAVLANISDKDISSSIKFRILYPMNINNINIKINNKPFKYDPEQPRYSFSLKPNEEIKLEMKADVSILYSIDAVRKSIKKMEEEEKSGGVIDVKKSAKSKGQDLANSFLRFFKSNDRYGKRFQIGPLVSKWGLFPVDFEKISLEIKTPENFTIITSYENIWQDVTKNKKVYTYKTTDTDNYNDAIFLPQSDKEEQLATMEVLKSERFKK